MKTQQSGKRGSGGGGSVGTLSQVLAAGNDGGGQTIENVILVSSNGDLDLEAGGNVGIDGDSFVITSTLTGAITAGTTLGITATTGAITVTAGAALNLTGVTGTTLLKAGAVGAVSIGWAVGQGIYQVSGTQTGFAIGGVLVGGFDSDGVFTSVITEQVGGIGITIIGTAGNLVLMQGAANEAFVKIPQSTTDSACINLGGMGADPTIPNEGDIWYDNTDNGFSFQTDMALDHITLVVDEGWALHTGTGSKAAFDADWTQSISAGYVQAESEAIRDQVVAVQKALAGIQDHLMTNMNLLQA